MMISSINGNAYAPQNIKYNVHGKVTSFTDTYIGSVDAFHDMAADLQKMGIISKDSDVHIEKLSDEQKKYLANKYDINNMIEQEQKNALLNELIEMGVITANEAVRGTYVAYTNLQTAATYVTDSGKLVRGLTMTHSLYPPVSIYESNNFMSYIKESLVNDFIFCSSQETVDAKNHILEILEEIFG